jgi:hypothetical protein
VRQVERDHDNEDRHELKPNTPPHEHLAQVGTRAPHQIGEPEEEHDQYRGGRQGGQMIEDWLHETDSPQQSSRQAYRRETLAGKRIDRSVAMEPLMNCRLAVKLIALQQKCRNCLFENRT